MELADRLLGLLHVVDDAVRVDEVERRVGKRQGRDRAVDEGPVDVLQLEPATRQVNRRRAAVEPGVARTRARELQSIRRDAAAGLEHVLPRPGRKPHDLGDVRLEGVAMALDRVIERRSAQFRPRETETGLVLGPERSPLLDPRRVQARRRYQTRPSDKQSVTNAVSLRQ
jgi:hypothetical protein